MLSLRCVSHPGKWEAIHSDPLQAVHSIVTGRSSHLMINDVNIVEDGGEFRCWWKVRKFQRVTDQDWWLLLCSFRAVMVVWRMHNISSIIIRVVRMLLVNCIYVNLPLFSLMTRHSVVLVLNICSNVSPKFLVYCMVVLMLMSHFFVAYFVLYSVNTHTVNCILTNIFPHPLSQSSHNWKFKIHVPVIITFNLITG